MPRVRTLVAAVVVLAASLASLPAAASADASDLLLEDVGSGFVRSGDDTVTSATATRAFARPGALLDLMALPVPEGIDVSQMFRLAQRAAFDGADSLPVSSLDLGVWLVASGAQPGDGPQTILVFASARSIFVATLVFDDPPPIDPVSFLLDVAERQIDAAGGSPEPSSGGVADPELTAALPTDVPGLIEFGTFDLGEDIPGDIKISNDVARFLDEGTATVVRLWSTTDGTVVAAAAVTRYPLELFAAASVPVATGNGTVRPLALGVAAGVPGVVAFEGIGERAGQYGAALRRGSLATTVLVQGADGVDPSMLTDVVGRLVVALGRSMPPGASSPYTFSGTPSTIAGIALSVLLVTAAVGGSSVTGRMRARRLRRRMGDREVALPTQELDGVVQLDGDADRLRSRARLVLGGQLISINVGVAALAGDFAWTGVVVATAALVAGLLFTTWWSRREHAILGPIAPRIDRVLPRPLGALLGLVAFAVLGFGGGFGLKGLRYLVLKPSLAQLKWADFFGFAPRTVGVLFAVGGFALVILGAGLFRLARAWSRSDTRRLLASDPRPPVLYLRSFEDDTVLLATIVSARRPFFELFSLRGADPFEESLAVELDTYGPVIAVGRPGRSLASLGAAREHLPDATWRDEVAARMAAARTIVVATGQTDGLRWELGHLVDGGHLAKTVFVFPPLPRAALQHRWAYTSDALVGAGVPLPELAVDAAAVHTVRVGPVGLEVTVASRRDEATYRTAIDVVLGADHAVVVS